MCFSVEASLTAWTYSMFVAVFLYQRNRNYDRWNSYFIATFAMIQLWEAGLWTNLNNKGVNSMLTKLIFITLLLEPVVQTYFGYRYTGSSVLQLLLYATIGAFIWGVCNMSGFHTVVGPNNHLAWINESSNIFLGNTAINLIFLSGLLIPLLFMGWRGVPLLTVGVLTAWYSSTRTSNGEFGSYWCYTAVLYSTVALLM